MSTLTAIVHVGKSTSLKNALSLFGVHYVRIYGPDTPAAAILKEASNSTIPIGKLMLWFSF